MKAAQGRVPVFLDGGVRRGTDVFKALALGASGIFVSKYTNSNNINLGNIVSNHKTIVLPSYDSNLI